MAEVIKREIVAGQNRIYLDDDNILHYINVGEIDDECARLSCEAMAELDSMVDGPVNYLIDLNRGGKTTPGARKQLKDYTESTVKGKLALWGLHPVARMLAAFFVNITSKKEMKVFKTEEEAIRWLKSR